MKAYSIIIQPSDSDFQSMSRKELKEQFNWYLSQIPQRTEILAEAIHSTTGYDEWNPYFSPESLIPLGQWFAERVETRKLTEEEKARICSTTPDRLKSFVGEDELTDRTISLAIDIGMYMAQVFLRNVPSLKWKLQLGSKRNFDYGQPVLEGFGNKVCFNPTRMIVTLAWGLENRKRDGGGLRELYDIWRKNAE